LFSYDVSENAKNVIDAVLEHNSICEKTVMRNDSVLAQIA